MNDLTHPRWTRRTFLWACLVSAALPLAACANQPIGGSGLSAAPIPAPIATPTNASPSQSSPTQPASATTTGSGVATPISQSATACAAVTLAVTEGPYFKANSPERATLIEAGVSGTSLLISGRVLTRNCQPVSRAKVDIWQADANGQYDNSGYRLRGHVLSDETGRYQIETIVPGLYPGRARHIHVKVRPPSGSTLTTQLFFPEEPGNQSDGIYRQSLELGLQDGMTGKAGRFDFVLDLASG